MSWRTPRKWPVPSHKCVQGLTGTPSLCLIIPLTPCWYVCRHFTMRRERWAQTRHLKVLPSKILDTGWPTTHNLAGTRQRGWTDPGLTSMLIRTWAERMRRSPLRVFITRLSPSRSFIWYSAFFFFLWRTSFKPFSLNLSFGCAGANTADTSLLHRASGWCRCAGKIMARQRLQCKEEWMDPDSGIKQAALGTRDSFQPYSFFIGSFINKHTRYLHVLCWNGVLSEMINLTDWKVPFLRHCSAASSVCGAAEGAEGSQLLHQSQSVASTGTRKQHTGLERCCRSRSLFQPGKRWGRGRRKKMVIPRPRELAQTIEDVFMWVEGCH